MERQPRRRRRAALSCLECQRRKIKCDRNDPCAHCVAVKTQCSYRFYPDTAILEHRSRTRSTPSLSDHTTTAAASVASTSVQAQHINSITATAVANHRAPVSVAATPSTVNQHSLSSQELDLGDLLQRIRKLEDLSTSVTLPPVKNGRPFTSQSGIYDGQVVLNKTRILNWSYWIGTAQELAPIVTCYSESVSIARGQLCHGDELRSLYIEISDLLQKCKSIARLIKQSRPSRRCQCPGFSLAPPTREMADNMVNLYFWSFESTHRILHEPTFRTDYERFWSDPENVTTDLELRVLLVISIGASLEKQSDISVFHQSVYAAQAWLSGPIEKDRLSIIGVQIHCLTILARQVFSIGGDLVWMSMGALMHTAMQIGLHRDPKYLPRMNLLQAEVHRRLWATILELAVQSALDSAMPPRISFDEFDTEAPSNNNDNEIDASSIALQPHPRDTYTDVSVQLLLLDSLPVRLRILRLLTALNSELSYANVLVLSSELSEAFRTTFSFSKKHELSPFRRNFFNFLVRRFMIPLHCPYANKARKNPLFYYSMKVSLETAIAMNSPEPDEHWSQLRAIGGGLFREGFRHAGSVISIELIGQTAAQQFDGTLDQNFQFREPLKQAVADMISLSVERIRQGETNVKSPMFLGMILAHVNAIETGTSSDLNIALSARENLSVCHDLLKARSGSAASPDYAASTGFGPDGYDMDFDFDFFLAGETTP